MGHRFLEITATPSVKAVQAERGSRRGYARLEGGPPTYDRLGEEEAEFIAARDHFVMATVSETGWPYVQHRGGPAGFLQVIDACTLAFADYRGNRQYISTGNAQHDPRVALLLIDHARRRRLKLLGRLERVDPARAPTVHPPSGHAPGAVVESVWRIHVEAFDWNCPQHITPRFTADEVDTFIAPTREAIRRLEEENRALRARLADATPAPR